MLNPNYSVRLHKQARKGLEELLKNWELLQRRQNPNKIAPLG